MVFRNMHAHIVQVQRKTKMWFPCKSGQWSLLMRAGRGLLRRCSVPFLHQPVIHVFKIIKLPCLVHWTPEHGHDFTVPSSKPFTSNIRENGNQKERSWHNVNIKICLSFPWRARSFLTATWALELSYGSCCHIVIPTMVIITSRIILQIPCYLGELILPSLSSPT